MTNSVLEKKIKGLQKGGFFAPLSSKEKGFSQKSMNAL